MKGSAARGALARLAILVATAVAVLGAAPEGGVYDFTLKRIDGREEGLATYRGKVALVVNVASRCGFTPQYEGLQALYERYADRGFTVLGFPSNDFKQQEPGTNDEIAKFCKLNYGVEFPMFAKIRVVGDDAHPLYRYLTGLPEPLGGPVKWNFQKYLVDREGRVVKKYSSRTEPDDPALVAEIERLLAEDG